MKKLKELFKKKPQGTISEIDPGIDNTVKKKYTTDITAKLLCFFAAVCLWFYVMDAENPAYKDTFSGIPVTFNTNMNGYEVLSSDISTIEVVLTGKRSVINSMKSSDITATVDISGITEPGEYPLNVKVKTSNETSVDNYSPKSIYVYLDKSSSRSVMVKADYTGGTSDNASLKIGELEPSKSFVSVNGPEEILSQIYAAEVTVELNLISHSVNITNKPLKLVGKNGEEINNQFVRLSDSAVDVYVPVYMEKELPIKPSYKYGYFDEQGISYVANPSTIRVRGEVDQISALEQIYTTEIDETTIGRSRTLQAEYNLPVGVSIVGSRNKCALTLSINNYAEKEISINNRRISFLGIDFGKTAYANESVSVRVCGNAETVLNVVSSDFSASVLLAGLSVGTHDGIPVEVAQTRNLPNAYVVKEAEKLVTSVTINGENDG